MNDVSRLIEKINFEGHTIERTRTTIHVVDPVARMYDRINGGVVAAYDYGPGWIGCSETGNVKSTSDPMETVKSLIRSYDVNGIPSLEDDGSRCLVCGEYSPENDFCSADCVRQAIDTQD